MPRKKLTQEEFISKAREVHSDKYDYSKAEYKNGATNVCIVCPIHGDFLQRAGTHLEGHGCKKCADDANKKPVCGIGILDVDIDENRIAYKIWSRMLQRCYKNEDRYEFRAYRDCTVCREWHKFSSFLNWFNERHIDGYELDKDILVQGNRLYSPTTCCFVPHEINMLFNKSKGNRLLPTGVSYDKNRKKFSSSISSHNKTIHLGYFTTVKEAFLAYKSRKENIVKELAEKYYQEGKIAQKVYEALMRYEVEPLNEV